MLDFVKLSEQSQFEVNYECLIIDDESRGELSPIISKVEDIGFAALHAQGFADLAVHLARYEQQRVRPAILLIDAHIPNYPNFALLGHPDIDIDNHDITGITLYDKILQEMPGIKDCPIMFISNHNNIAAAYAHTLRTSKNKQCIFVAKGNFQTASEPFLKAVAFEEALDPDDIFSAQDYEHLWAGICDYYNLKEDETFSALGLNSNAAKDFLSFIRDADDARQRIDWLVDIGTWLRILYGDEKKQRRAMNDRTLMPEFGCSIRDVIGRGKLTEVQQVWLHLGQLCGAK